MAGFFRDWLHNLWISMALFIGAVVFMLVFTKIFFPDALGMLWLTGQFTVGLISTLKWWPIVVLMIIVSAFPRRRRR